MERLGRLHDHRSDIDRAIALSLADEEEKQVVKELQQEEEELLVAITCFQTEEERKKEESVLRELHDQEETEVEIAMAVSQADFYDETLSLPTDDLEYIFNEALHLNPDRFPTENETLAEMYRKYRQKPTFFTETQMWPLSAIIQQQQELLQCLSARDEVTEWQKNMCESHRCLICLTNVGTRFATPCGHRLCCHTCLPELVNKRHFYYVTAPNGDVVATDRRIPLQCFTCRAIIGHIVVPIFV